MKNIYLMVLLLNFLICSACVNKDGKELNLKVQEKSHNQQVEITFPYKAVVSPALYGDDIFLSVSDKDDDTLSNKVVHYNRKNKQLKSIFTSQFTSPAVQGTQANEDWVIWMDADETGSEVNMYAMNRKTGEVKRISKGSSKLEKGSPFLYKHFVAWIQEAPNGKAVIRLYDLKSNHITDIESIEEYSFLNNFVHMNEDILVYTDIREGITYYGLYNLKNQQKEWLPSNEKYLGYTKFIKGQLISIRFQNPNSWDNQDLISYDLKNKKTTILPINSDANKKGDLVRSFEVSSDNLYVATVDSELLFHYKLKDGGIKEYSRISVPYDFRVNEEKRLLIVNDPHESQIAIPYK